MNEILQKLASVQGRRDEVPNQELAKEISESADKASIKTLIEHLINNKDKKIQQDCIKVLYEIGAIEPKLISPYLETFLQLLESKNNRLVWGGMTAIDSIVFTVPEEVIQNLSAIQTSMEKGSVITKDHGIFILAKLASQSAYHGQIFPLLMDELWKCPPKQLPMYAERSMIAVKDNGREEFMKLLNDRLPDLEKESQKKRIAKVLKKHGSLRIFVEKDHAKPYFLNRRYCHSGPAKNLTITHICKLLVYRKILRSLRMTIRLTIPKALPYKK